MIKNTQFVQTLPTFNESFVEIDTAKPNKPDLSRAHVIIVYNPNSIHIPPRWESIFLLARFYTHSPAGV